MDANQLRLHYLYVYFCRNELAESIERACRHVDTSDISLTMRLCQDARDGKLQQHTKCLNHCLNYSGKSLGIQVRHLPFLFLLLRANGNQDDNIDWLKKTTGKTEKIKDAVIRKFVEVEFGTATR